MREQKSVWSRGPAFRGWICTTAVSPNADRHATMPVQYWRWRLEGSSLGDHAFTRIAVCIGKTYRQFAAQHAFPSSPGQPAVQCPFSLHLQPLRNKFAITRFPRDGQPMLAASGETLSSIS